VKHIHHFLFLAAMAAAAPALAAKPVPLKPANNPGDWITSSDYPPAALRQSSKGTTGFRLAIDAMGHVTACTITASSGSSLLDDTSCALLKARATFIAARDGRGRAVAATYSSGVRWQIPNDTGPTKYTMLSCALGPPGDIQVVTPQGCAH
jgi:periplasmic protein TonB